MRRLFLLVALAGLAPGSGVGQEGPALGVVWDPPGDLLQAEADLRAIRSTGFEAVRTSLVRREAILDLADTLGLVLYQEVQVHFRTPGELADTSDFVRTEIRNALARADGHPSARYFGLGISPATVQDAACVEIADLVAELEDQTGPNTEFYYVSWTPGSDPCTESVGLVLLDDPIHEYPERLLDRWEGRTAVGLAAVGRRVDPDAPRGLTVEYSEERQALFLEEVVPRLRSRSDMAVAFLYRWRDPEPGDGAAFHPVPFGVSYGLHDDAGRPRRARDVADGLLAHGQTTFRLDAGTPPGPDMSWFVLLGWIVLTTIAVMVAASPRFRAMVPRYFFSHGFYRHAIQEGRDVLTVLSAILLVLLGLVMGMLGSQVTRMLTDSAPLHAVWYRSSVPGRAAMDALLTDTVLLVVFIGSAGLLALVIWVGVWSVARSRRAPIKPSQALATAVWPRWPMLVLLVAAMVVDGFEPEAFRQAIHWLPGAWLVVALWATIRTNVDLAQIARLNPAATIVLWLLSPVVLLMVAAVAFMLLRSELAMLLWALWTA